MIFCSILVLAMWMGLVISVSISEETYALSEPKIIRPYETYEFQRIKLLKSEKSLVNMGTLSARAPNDAQIILHDFTNDVLAQTSIECVGDLMVELGGFHQSSKGSTFQVSAKAHMTFSVAESARRIFNNGAFLVSSDTLEFDIPGSLVNSGTFSLSALGNGLVKFGGVLNHDVMNFRVATSTSRFSLGDLINIGEFCYNGHRQLRDTCPESIDTELDLQAKRKVDVALDVRGSMTNLGVMNFAIECHQKGAFQQGGEIRNNGLICLTETYFQQIAGITGEGCWVLDGGSWFQLDREKPFGPGQIIVLNHPSAYISIASLGKDYVIIDIYGFEKVAFPIRSQVNIDEIVYQGNEGLLWVCNSDSDYIIFNIGKGFEESGFTVDLDMVHYNGNLPPERAIPSVCKCGNTSS